MIEFENANQTGIGVSAANPLPVTAVLPGVVEATPLPTYTANNGYPPGAVPSSFASGNVAASAAVATAPADAARKFYLTGFEVTGSGATAALAVNFTIAGLVGGTLTYTFTAPIGVAVPCQPLCVSFPYPLATTAVNTAVVATLPTLGSGNAHAAVVIHGYYL